MSIEVFWTDGTSSVCYLEYRESIQKCTAHVLPIYLKTEFERKAWEELASKSMNFTPSTNVYA